MPLHDDQGPRCNQRMSPILFGFILAGIVALLLLVALSCGKGTPTIQRGAAGMAITPADQRPANMIVLQRR